MEPKAYDRRGQLVYDPFENKVRRIVTSTLVLMISFIIANIAYQLLICAVTKLIGYQVFANYNKVFITGDYRNWSVKRVLAVYFFCPLLFVFISLLLRRQYRNYHRINIKRMFLFWLMVCFMNFILANLAIAPLGIKNYSSALYNNFTAVGAWMGLSNAVMYLLSIFAMLCSLTFGILIAKELFRFSFSKGLIATQAGKSGNIFQLFVLPVIFGFIPLTLLGSGTNTARIGLMVANLLLIGFGMLVRVSFKTKIAKHSKNKDALNQLPVKEFFIAAAIWATIFFFFRG